MKFIIRGARRILRSVDAAATRAFGWAWNPLHQTGTVAVAMLLVLIVTGLYLLLYYRVGAPWESVARLAAQPWAGRWIRSLHRYASDLFVIAAVLHAFRMFAQSRSWGPRTLAWISGLVLFGVGLVCAWTGFVMVWDAFGERLAREGGRLLDVLPVFSEPLSRIFAGDAPVPSAFFFVNMFLHIALPLAMGAGLWLHVSRLARPVLLPPKRLTQAIIGGLTAASLLLPAPVGAPADAFRLAESTLTNLVTAWWLPVSERLTPGMAWGVVLLGAAVAVLVPRFGRRPRAGALAPSVVDPALCTGCNQCPQDCPWEAIAMVPRDDDRPALVALVNPARCVSCGICAGSCAPMGVGPAGRSGRDQLSLLRSTFLPELARSGNPSIVAVCCAQAPEADTAALRARGARVHPVSCAGNLHTSGIELLLRSGASGVIVYGCPPRDCVGREGPKWLRERVFNDREAELQPRVDRRRVRLATMAPGARSEAVDALDAFTQDLVILEPHLPDPDADLEVECVPVPSEEEDA
jgi:coenzyme F420-reducing hydrogenase delta subunit/NAD-dependent dihydropyrimidine dehydrogenase PreA subunit